MGRHRVGQRGAARCGAELSGRHVDGGHRRVIHKGALRIDAPGRSARNRGAVEIDGRGRETLRQRGASSIHLPFWLR